MGTSGAGGTAAAGHQPRSSVDASVPCGAGVVVSPVARGHHGANPGSASRLVRPSFLLRGSAHCNIGGQPRRSQLSGLRSQECGLHGGREPWLPTGRVVGRMWWCEDEHISAPGVVGGSVVVEAGAAATGAIARRGHGARSPLDANVASVLSALAAPQPARRPGGRGFLPCHCAPERKQPYPSVWEPSPGRPWTRADRTVVLPAKASAVERRATAVGSRDRGATHLHLRPRRGDCLPARDCSPPPR